MKLAISIFTALWFWFAAGAPGYTFHYVLKQPLVMALPIGLIMGDVPQAMMIGAAIELVYVGIISPGANVPADECLAGVIAIPIAMSIGADPKTAVVLAVPFGVLGVFLDQLRRTVNARWAHVADKYAEEGNEKGLFRCAFIYPMLVGFIMRFPPVFIANYFGADVVQNFLNAMPKWVIEGISVTGGVLPALGFAIILFVIGQRSLMPFYFMGFFAVKYLGINTMAAAVFGTCIALVILFMKNDGQEEVLQKIQEMNLYDDDDDE